MKKKSNIVGRGLATCLVISAFVLAACGGGGSSDSSTTKTNNSGGSTGSTATVSIITPAATLSATPSPSGNATVDGIAYLDAMRHNVGYAGTLSQDTGLTTASTDHTAYLIDNQTYGHDETSGLPGYTGATPESRILAQGNYSYLGEVVVAGNPGSFANSVSSAQTLFDAPYHRIGMLDDFSSMGVASETTSNWEVFNIDFGNSASSLSNTSLVAYPFPGQTGTPTYWYANESPNPFASQTQYELTDVGYPVTVESGFQGKLSSVAMTLTDSSGNNVSCLVVSPDTDPTDLSNGAMCIPYKVLSPSTTYTARVTATLTAGGVQYPVNESWSFTTGTAVPVAQGVTGGAATQPIPKF